MASAVMGLSGGGAFQGLSAAAPTSTVELSISCRNLRDLDVLSKSDPLCALFIEEFGQRNWREIGRTEKIDNTLNPDFAKKFVLTYFFEESQKLRFDMFDIDSSSTNLSNHEFLGRAECTLAEIVSVGSITKPLIDNGKQFGTIIVSAEELAGCKEEILVQFTARNLEKKGFWLFFGSSNPFLTISKANENNTFTVVHRTEHVKHSSHPSWKQISISGQSLCNGDYDRVLKVECHDWKWNGNHNYIGEFTTTLRTLAKGVGSENTYEFINKEKQKKAGRKYKNSGEVHLGNIQITRIHSFLDYIRGGTELLCTIAIDFTSSNGDPRMLNSLHFIDQYRPNQYACALKAVGEIVQEYDSDKLFPLLGFGARVPPDGLVSHEFFVNLHPTNPYCEGITGVMNAYHQCLGKVQLYGPTNFAPIIHHVSRIASNNRDGSKYHILLIITDGIITDMQQTKEAIVNASVLPLSIIIVGVGNADFGAMEELDGDVVRISYKGRYAERDIVQFVAYRDFESGMNGPDPLMSQARLAKAVLAEIPGQFLSFMKRNNVIPAPPKTVNSFLPHDLALHS